MCPIESAHDLAGEVDLDRRVDRDHPREGADDVGVVREIDGPHLDHGVVVNEVVEAGRAHHERRHDLAAVAFLGIAGDHAGLDELHHGVREHLGVDPEVVFVGESQGGRRRDGPDPQLEGRAIGHEFRDVLPDPPLHIPDARACDGVRQHVHLDRQVDVVDVDEALAERPRHRLIDLHDHGLRRIDGRVHRLDAGPERAEAMGIGRRRVHEDHVEREGTRSEQAWDVG